MNDKNRIDDKERFREDMEADAIGRLLREELPRYDDKPPSWMSRGWKPAPGKIAALAAVVVVLGAGIALLPAGPGPGPEGTDGRGMVVETDETQQQQAEESAAGLFVLVEGKPAIVREGSKRDVAMGDKLLPGDRLETGKDDAVGIKYAGGPSFVLESRGRLEVESASRSEVRLALERGTLAARVPMDQPGQTVARLTVGAKNAVLTAERSVFTAEAEDGRLTAARVAEGQVDVRRKETGKTLRVGRSSALDLRTFTVLSWDPHGTAMARLALITDGIDVPSSEEEGQEAGDVPTSDEPRKASSLVERIKQALESGNVEEALRLIETKGQGQGSAAFHVLAGDTYRKAGRWAEAAEAYMTAAEKGSGKQAERALLRAAEIQLRKLGKPAEAASVIDAYMKSFPSGKHLDEALYLGGVANMKSGSLKIARALLQRYLAAFPNEPKSAGVHLMLAKILAVRMSDCAGAAPHIKAVLKKAPGSGMAGEAQKIAAGCAKNGKSIKETP